MMIKKRFILCLIIAACAINLIIPLMSAEIIINEVMHSPIQCSDSYCEYVEVYNNGTEAINLTDWKLCTNNLLAGYVNRSGATNLNTSMILQPNSFALITDGGSGTEVYSNFSVDLNAIAIHVSGSTLCGGLTSNENISLFNNNSLNVNQLNYTSSWGANSNSKSLQYCNNSGNWTENPPTPGSLNNCTFYQAPTCTPSFSCSNSSCSSNSLTQTCTNITSNCSNIITTLSFSCNSSSSSSSTVVNLTEDISLDWNETSIIAGNEFNITIKAYNLNGLSYDLRVWLAFDNDTEKAISDRYDSNKSSWSSGNYYIDNFFTGPGDITKSITLKIRDDFLTYYGDVKIHARLRKNGNSVKSISNDITLIQGDSTSTSSNTTTPALLSSENTNAADSASAPAGAIDLRAKKSASKGSDSIIYKSKTEYIKEYTPYIFGAIGILLTVLLVLDRSKETIV